MQLVDKQIPKFDERFISAVFPLPLGEEWLFDGEADLATDLQIST